MIKQLVYKYLRALKNKIIPGNVVWQGNYKTWEAAQRHCSGYSEDIILEKVKSAALTVKSGEACYERDSVLFYKPQIAEELVSILLQVPVRLGSSLNVLDFGGSLGSSYFQNRSALTMHRALQWNIVEQEHYVNCGKEYFETDELHFFNTIEECADKQSINVILAACVLQYIPNPYQWIDKFMGLNSDYIIFDRMGFIDNVEDVLTVQTVPPSIYKGSYPCYFFNKEKVIKKMEQSGFSLLKDWGDQITSPVKVNGKHCKWESLVFKRESLTKGVVNSLTDKGSNAA